MFRQLQVPGSDLLLRLSLWIKKYIKMIAVGLFYLQIGVVGIKHKGIEYFSLRFLFIQILVFWDARFF